MNYRTLGRTGLRVSRISLGTVEIGMAYGIGANSRPDEAEADRLLHGALDSGINYLDTARVYGESEAIIGRALGLRRPEYLLTTKALPGSYAETAASLEQSLQLLQTDYIDIFMLHSASLADVQSDEAAEAMRILQARGLIRYTGASVYGNVVAEAAIRTGHFDCLQLAYSIVDRRAETAIAALAREQGVGLVARSVLLKGALTSRGKLLPKKLMPLKSAVARMSAIADRAGCSLPELAYRYVLTTDVVQTALSGASSLCELDDAVRYANAPPLPSCVLAEIQADPVLDSFFLNPGNWPSF